MPSKAVYVLIADSSNASHADMTVVSALSLQASNPALPACLICDREAYCHLNDSRHPLLDLIHEIQVVDTPAESAVFRHRWIKTQLPRYLSGPAIHIDGDTLVRRHLPVLRGQGFNLAAALDHNRRNDNTSEPHYPPIEKALEIGWEIDLKNYLNSGILFWDGSPSSQEFFKQWHYLWLQGVEAACILQDQPSFNAMLMKDLLPYSILSNSLNTQIFSAWELAPEATIWHFFGSVCEPWPTSFSALVTKVKQSDLKHLAADVKRVIRLSKPWPCYGLFALQIERLALRKGKFGTFESLWLSGKRKAAIGHLKDRFVRKLLAPLR